MNIITKKVFSFPMPIQLTFR